MEVLKRSEIAQPSHSRSKTRQVPLALLPKYKANSFPQLPWLPPALSHAALVQSISKPYYRVSLLLLHRHSPTLIYLILPPWLLSVYHNRSCSSWEQTPRGIPRTHDGACSIGSIALLTRPTPKSILFVRVPCIWKFHLGEALLVVICHLPSHILGSENSHSLNPSKKKCLEQEVHFPHQHSY